MEVKLKKNGWHRKLQAYVFEYPPTFYNFCPYFWLTIFCILVTFIIPVVPLCKGLKWLFLGIFLGFNKGMEFFNDNICEPFFEWIAKNMPEDDIMKAWTVNFNYSMTPNNEWWNSPEGNDYQFWRDEFTVLREMDYGKREKYVAKFKLWKKNTPDWEKKLEVIREKQKAYWLKKREDQTKAWYAQYEKEKIENEKRALAAEKNKLKDKKKKEMFISIVKYTKYLAYTLGAAVIALAGYGMYLLINLIYNSVVWYEFWPKLLNILAVVGIAVTAVLTFMGFIYGIILLIKKCKISVSDIPGMRTTGGAISRTSMWIFRNGMVPVAELVWKFLCWLGGGFEFLWMYIVTLKENNCPGIIWEEEKPKR